MMDLVRISYDDKYRSEIFISTIPTLAMDFKVKIMRICWKSVSNLPTLLISAYNLQYFLPLWEKGQNTQFFKTNEQKIFHAQFVATKGLALSHHFLC